MFFSCECFVLSGECLCVGLIYVPRSPAECGVCVSQIRGGHDAETGRSTTGGGNTKTVLVLLRFQTNVAHHMQSHVTKNSFYRLGQLL